MIQFSLVFISIFKIVCYFNIFNKCGDKGWKAIIPFLETYTRFKLFYKKQFFIIFLIIVAALSFSIVMITTCGLELMTYYNGDPYSVDWVYTVPENLLNATTMFFFMFIICSFIIFILDTILNYYMAKSFNKGLGFFFGLVFLNVIFLAILSFFNENKYIGNTKVNINNTINYQ